MRLFKLVSVIAFGTLAATNAFAEFSFTDVSVTPTTVTFTINGDMSGYVAPPSGDNQFSIDYSGASFSSIITYTPNSWSTSVFDNFSLTAAGNTGGFGSTVPYSWSWYNGDLASATATNRTVTLTTANDFGSGTAGTLTFEWGNGFKPSSDPTDLGSVTLAPTSAVPEPESAGLMALGIAFVGCLRRVRRTKQLV